MFFQLKTRLRLHFKASSSDAFNISVAHVPINRSDDSECLKKKGRYDMFTIFWQKMALDCAEGRLVAGSAARPKDPVANSSWEELLEQARGAPLPAASQSTRLPIAPGRSFRNRREVLRSQQLPGSTW